MNGNVTSHEFTPTLGDPGSCGVGTCGAPWFHPVHNPANNPKWGGTPRTFPRNGSYTEILNEAIIRADKVNQSLFADESEEEVNASRGLPTWVNNPDQPTPPHRFAMKSTELMSNKYIENVDFCDNCDCLYTTAEFHPDERAIRCPISTSCSDYAFDRPSHYVNHAMDGHDLTQDQAIDYLQNPWYVGETRSEWQGRVPDLQWWRKYQTGPGSIKVQITPDTETLRNALRTFSMGFRSLAPTPVSEDAGDPTEAREEPTFRDWWVDWVEEAAPTIQRKAEEYGSNSLAEMGRMFARAQGRGQIEDHEALEIGCMVYAKGKIERVLDAMLKGGLPSADTWGDTMIYAAMASYIREFSRWP